MILGERGFRQPALRRDSWKIVSMFHVEHLWWQYCTYINVREPAVSLGRLRKNSAGCNGSKLEDLRRRK
jgi:hypothetical protein